QSRRGRGGFAAVAVCCCLLFLAACSGAWNYPYVDTAAEQRTRYMCYTATPNHLDPALSYSANEVRYNCQIYEPPLQYHYLLRPYELVPRTATEVPEPVLLDEDGNRLPADAPDEAVATSVWRIHIQPGIRFQPHPAFATDDQG